MKYIVHEIKMEILKFIFVNFLRGCISHHSFRQKTQVHIRKQIFQSLINIHIMLILPRHKITVSINVHNDHIHRDTKKTWKWWYTVCMSVRLLLRGSSCEISCQSHSPTKKSKELTLKDGLLMINFLHLLTKTVYNLPFTWYFWVLGFCCNDKNPDGSNMTKNMIWDKSEFVFYPTFCK